MTMTWFLIGLTIYLVSVWLFWEFLLRRQYQERRRRLEERLDQIVKEQERWNTYLSESSRTQR